MRRRLGYWAEALCKGLPSLYWLIGFLIVVIGGSVSVAVAFGAKHVGWAVAIVMGGLLIVTLEGAANMAAERDEALTAARSAESLDDWLKARSDEMQALGVQLRQIGDPDDRDDTRFKMVFESWLAANADVIRRLHVAAPEWVDYYSENPDWLGADRLENRFEALVKVIDYAVEQIATIRARL
jgi:hypothetical protein